MSKKALHLGPMLRGDVVWCQLFSEPGAGSDLANLSTRAERDGDEFVVNGQKVWNSSAHLSDWGILLARTDPDAPKHKGITFFLLDMATPGVDPRPIRTINGSAHFNEVFLSDVRVPAENVVGEVNGGWAVTRLVLANESTMIGGGMDRADSVANLIALAQRWGMDQDPMVRQELAQAYTKEKLLDLMGRAAARGHPPGSPAQLRRLDVEGVLVREPPGQGQPRRGSPRGIRGGGRSRRHRGCGPTRH